MRGTRGATYPDTPERIGPTVGIHAIVADVLHKNNLDSVFEWDHRVGSQRRATARSCSECIPCFLERVSYPACLPTPRVFSRVHGTLFPSLVSLRFQPRIGSY